MKMIRLEVIAYRVKVIHLLDWQPPEVYVRDEQELMNLKKLRSRQSEKSKQRQNFISGMGVHRIGRDELAAKRQYIEDWHYQVRENDW